jgi:hypothetical protein
MKRTFLITWVIMTLAAAGWAQSVQQDSAHDMKDCPMHEQRQAGTSQHDHDLAKRGEQGMGFSQEKTTHHFFLSKDGGTIQVTANTGDDKTSVEQIRRHFEHISHAFQSGDFNIPMFVHDQTPPGVSVMIRLKGSIHYKYEEIEKGARVVISSDDAEAVKAVQQFLQFQITEHKTGDSLEMK